MAYKKRKPKVPRYTPTEDAEIILLNNTHGSERTAGYERVAANQNRSPRSIEQRLYRLLNNAKTKINPVVKSLSKQEFDDVMGISAPPGADLHFSAAKWDIRIVDGGVDVYYKK